MSILRKPILREFACCAELVVTIPDVFNGFKPQQNRMVYPIKW